MVWQALAGAAIGAISAAQDRKAGASANRKNWAMNQANIASQEKINAQNIAFARETNELARYDAGREIQRRALDAKAAGLHPLAALGAQTSSPSLAVPHAVAPRADIPMQPVASSGAETMASVIQGLMQLGVSNDQRDVLKSEAELNRARKDQIYMDAIASAGARATQHAMRTKDASGKVQDIVVDPVQGRQMTGPRGGNFTSSPSTTAQTVEDEYGGIAGEAYGLYRAGVDAYQKLQTTYKIDQTIQSYIDKALDKLNNFKINDRNRRRLKTN